MLWSYISRATKERHDGVCCLVACCCAELELLLVLYFQRYIAGSIDFRHVNLVQELLSVQRISKAKSF